MRDLTKILTDLPHVVYHYPIVMTAMIKFSLDPQKYAETVSMRIAMVLTIQQLLSLQMPMAMDLEMQQILSMHVHHRLDM